MNSPKKQTVLLVDDERCIRESLARVLTDADYYVLTAKDGETALRLFSDSRPDVVLLDVMMPRMDGYTACAAMRRIDRETPIVFLSAMDSEPNQIRGLELGADDYVSKTASDAMLMARIRKAIERADRFSQMDAPPSMTKTEADIFRLLESQRGRFFSYREIVTAICGDGYSIDDRAIRVHMSHLRRKLPRGISLTVRRGIGYALA